MENNKMIRIKDIAKLAGVSVGTVDRVIHQRGKVSETARKKVEKVLQEIDYTPNLLAKTLGSNKVFHITALVPHPEEDPYWKFSAEGLKAAQEEWKPYNVELSISYFQLFNPASFKALSQKVLADPPDAIICAPIFQQEAIDFFRQLDKASIPYVHFNTQLKEAQALSFVGQDAYQSGKLGASLVDLAIDSPGTIAILHIFENIQSSVHFQEKERGFRDYFKEKKTKPIPVISITIDEGDKDSFEPKIMKMIKEENITGFFIPSSSGTNLTANILQKHHKSDVCIVGYDLLQENIRYLRSGEINFLINQNPKRQAFRGINQLANYLLLKKRPPETDLFPLEIISPHNLDSYLQNNIY